MPQPGQRTITFSGKVLKKLEEIYNIEKNKNPALSFASFISESALIELKGRKFLRKQN